MRSNDHDDAPNPPRGDPKSVVAKQQIFDHFGSAKGTPNGVFQVPKGVKKHIKKLLEIQYRKKLKFECQNHLKMTPTLVQNIMTNDATNCRETCLDIYKQKHVLAKV